MTGSNYQYLFRKTDRVPCGVLNEKTLTPLDLLGTQTDLAVQQYCARATTVYTYLNAESRPLEAIFAFPVVEGWAVCGFEMESDTRSWRMAVQPRDEKHREYRDSCFIAPLGTLQPEETCRVAISYVMETLYTPDGTTLTVTLSKEICPLQAKKETELQGWKNAFTVQGSRRPPHALRIDLVCALEWDIEAVECSMPTAELRTNGPRLTGWYETIVPGEQPLVMDQDFVLQFRLKDPREQLKVSVVKEVGDGVSEQEAYVLAMAIVPQFREDQMANPNSEIVFVVDCSGSMSQRMAEVERSVKLCLQGLPQSAHFNVCLFGDAPRLLDEAACLPFTTDNLLWGRGFLHNLEANMGGTDVAAALKAVYRLPITRGYCRQVLLITDGAIPNPYEVTRLVQQQAAGSRLFVFHVDPAAADRQPLQELARISSGRYQSFGAKERLTEPLLTTLEGLLQPCLTSVALRYTYEFAGTPPADGERPPIRNVCEPLPLLFHRRRVTALAFAAEALRPNAVVRLSGWLGDQLVEWVYHLGPMQAEVVEHDVGEAQAHSPLHTVAALHRVRALTEFSTKSCLSPEDAAEVHHLARTFRLVTPLTRLSLLPVSAVSPSKGTKAVEVACEFSYSLPRHAREVTEVERPKPPKMKDPPRPSVRVPKSKDDQFRPPAPAPKTTFAFMREIVHGVVETICRQSMLDDLVFIQTASGSWLMNSVFAQTLDSSVAELMQAIPPVDKGVPLDVPSVRARNRRLEEWRRRAEEAELEKKRKEEEVVARRAKLELERQLRLQRSRAMRGAEEDGGDTEEEERRRREEEAQKTRQQEEVQERERKEREKEAEKERKRKEAERKKLVKKLGEEAVLAMEEAEARREQDELRRQEEEVLLAKQRERHAQELWEAGEREQHIANIWATALALAYLTLTHTAKAQEYALVSRRGLQWLLHTGVPDAAEWPRRAEAFLKPLLEEQREILQYEREVRAREYEAVKRMVEAEQRIMSAGSTVPTLCSPSSVVSGKDIQILVQQPDPADDLSRASSAEETEETRRQYWASVEEAERHAHAVEEEPGIVVVEPDHGESADPEVEVEVEEEVAEDPTLEPAAEEAEEAEEPAGEEEIEENVEEEEE